MANKTLDELIEQVNKRKEEKRTAEKELKKTFKETAVDSKGSKKSESTPKAKTDTEKKSFADTIADRAAEARDENTKKKLSAVGIDPGLVDRYNQRMAENEAEKKAGSGKNYGSFTSILRDKKAQEMLDQLDVRKSSEGSVTRAHSSALDKARRSKLPNSGSAADFVQSRSERMGKLAIGDGRVNEDLKLEKELADAKRKIQWEEAQKRYDALSDEEKQALYRRHNSSALDRARMSAEENPALQGGGTLYDTRTAIGQNIADRYYNLEEKVTDPNAAGEYAFLNRMRSAAGTTAENLGNWAYDTLGWEPGKETYERGEARKIGEIASQQLQNELAMHPTQTGQDFVKAADSIANMVSYKIASAPISLFASAVAGDLATNAALKKGSDAIGKAAQAGETVDANKIIAQAVEKGLKKSHDVSGSIFTSSMALGSFGDKYIESRAEGQGKLESSVRAVTAAVISYATESLGGIGGSKSPLNKLENAAKKKWVTNVIYNAFEEGGEEFAEYTLNYIANGIIDLVAQGKWSQEWNNAEVWENMRVAGISGGMFGAASGGINVFSGNAKVDAQLDSAGKEFLNYLDAVYKAEQDPAVRAAVEAQIDGMFDDAGIGVLANRNKAAEQSEAEQGKAEQNKADTETEMLDQLDTAKEAERAAARETETIRKTIESVKSSNLTADEKLARIRNLYNGSENAEARRALKAAFAEIQSEAKAEQAPAQNTEQVQPQNVVNEQAQPPVKPEAVEQVQPTQEAAGQTLQTNEETNAPAKQTPEKAAQSGTQRKADSGTLRRAYAEYSKDNPSAMDKKKFDKLYNEAYNAESFDDVLSKHKKLGDSLKKVLQKAFDNGHRAETKAAKNAMLDSGLVMNDGDEYMLNNRGDIDTLIDSYERAIEDGYVPIETAGENQDRESLADQYRELSDRYIENYRNAIEKLKKYKDEHFPKAKQGVSTGNKDLSTGDKGLSTEQKNLSTDNKGLSTEMSTSKETKRLESVIKNLTELKRNLENGNMEKLEHQNPEKYNSLMYKLEQRTADKNGSDYFGSAEDVQVLIDKYKADLDVLKAENGAQNTAPAENSGAQEIENGAQNKKAAEAVENKEPKAQSYEDFKKNPPADGEKSPIKVSPYTVIKSPYEGESPNNKADAKSERVEVSAESFAEGKSVYEIRTNGGGQAGIASKVKKALTDILNSIGGQHSVTANNIEFGGKPYEVAVNPNIAGKLAGDPNASAEKFAVLKNIDGIIENAEYVGSGDYIQHGARNKNVTRYDYFETKATIDGKPYVVAFDVEVYPDTNNYRTHKVLNEISLTAIPDADTGPVPAATDIESSLQGDVPSPKTNIPQNGSDVKPGSEYSPEYQNGAEHPGTVGGMESDRSNITRAANESGTLPAKKNPFSDFDKYKADENVPSGEKAALARTINDPMLGEITVAQNVTNMAKDGAKFVAQDGFFYAQYEDGTSVKVSKSVYNFGKFLNEQGVQYTLNQNAEMPQKMGKKYVSKAVTSFIASRGGTDAVVEAIQAKIEADEPGFTYERKGHKKIMRVAGEKIVEMGFDGAVEFFRERAQGDYKYTPELNALGIMLSSIADESNTKEGTNLATTIMGWVAANQTNAGQVTESMKLVRKLVENNSEIYYQSLVDSLQKKYKKELKGENITLDMELLKKVSETAGTKENAKWADKLNMSIANQIPATSLEKLNAFRYFCMLSSGRTHAKNIISNAAMFTMVVQKNLWLSVFERMYKAKNPDYMLTTSGLKTSADSQRFAREIFDVLKSNMDSGGNKYTPGDFVQQYRTNTMQGNGKYAKYNLPGWVLDRFANATTGLLSAEDMVAKKALFVNRFAQIMEANGWTSEFLSDNTNPKAIRAYENAADIAIEEAMKGTFNDKNPWTNVINAWRKMETIDFHDRSSKAVVGTLIEIMLPFKNVPLNIAKAAIQYSPIGIINGVVDLNRGAKNGTLEPRIALENIAKGATGTTVSIGGLMLAMMGFLTLGKGKDEDKPIAEKEDTTMYLKFPDEEKGNVYIEIDWIDSVAMQLRFGLELKDIFDEASKNKKNGDGISLVEDFVSSVLASAGRTLDTYMDIGMMSSVQNTLLNKSGADSMTDFFTDKGVNLLTQFVPRLLTDIRQAFDKEKRNTYYVADVDSDSKWLHLTLNQLTAAYGDRSKLPARIDEWGNSLGEENDAKRIIESMISPSKWYREDKDKVEEMLDQLDTKVDANVFPGDYPKQITVNGEKIKLSGKEYEEVARQIGKERYKLLDELRKDKSFQKLSADEKADIIQKCYTIANEMAKAGFDDNYAISTVTRNVQDAEKAKIPISTYLTIAQAYSNMAEYEKNGVTVSTSEQLAEYLIKDKSTTAEEDIKLFELLTRKKKDGSYSSPLDNIKKVPKADAEEQLKLYQITKIKDKEEAIQTYMLEGYNSAEALARYNVAKGAKTKYSGLGTNQKKKTDKLLAASKNGKTECKWTEEKLTLAACAVTSIGDYGTLKTQKYYVQMLMAVGFTEKEAKEFYKYYA